MFHKFEVRPLVFHLAPVPKIGNQNLFPSNYPHPTGGKKPVNPVKYRRLMGWDNEQGLDITLLHQATQP